MQTQEKTSKTVQFPDVNDHMQHQQGVRAKNIRHQQWLTPEDVVNYLVGQVQRKYRKGRRDVEAKAGFPLKQIDGLFLEPDGLLYQAGYQRTLQHERLRSVFQPLIDQAFDHNQLLGEMTIEIHGKGCTITVKYQVMTPKQFRH
jgi:hypothetical protein